MLHCNYLLFVVTNILALLKYLNIFWQYWLYNLFGCTICLAVQFVWHVIGCTVCLACYWLYNLFGMLLAVQFVWHVIGCTICLACYERYELTKDNIPVKYSLFVFSISPLLVYN